MKVYKGSVIVKFLDSVKDNQIYVRQKRTPQKANIRQENQTYTDFRVYLFLIDLINSRHDVRKEVLMSCRCFKEDLFGTCVASESPHVVSIEEMENFCFRDTFRHCPVFETNSSGGEIKTCRDEKSWLRQYLYSDCSQREVKYSVKVSEYEPFHTH
jgi:hypothetical protein